MSPISPPIRAVLVDAGGVLLLPEREPLLAALDRAGVRADPTLLDCAHYAAIAEFDRTLPSPVAAGRAYRRTFARAAGAGEEQLDAAEAELEVAFRSGGSIWSREVAGSSAALRRLVAAGFSVAVVSNTEGGDAAELLRGAGICQVGPGRGADIVAIVDSKVVGVAKPDPAIFAIALDAVAVEPAAAVHVGDSAYADVGGALATGLQAVHVDPLGRCPDRSHEHVTGLAAVPALLGA